MGSYSQTTAIYREDNMELLYVLHGQEGGITHVSQCSHYLFDHNYSNRIKEKIIFLHRSSSQKMETIYIQEAAR